MITEQLQQEVQHVTYQSRDELISAVAGGVRVKYLFFWDTIRTATATATSTSARAV